jgi:tRNA-Thr(GGU) m(6)t(6)A37 methyltransferase TsaA
MTKTIQAIGYIENDFTEKFGIPRQSGKAEGVISRVHFYPPFSAEECFKDIEGFSHLWLLFDFSAAKTDTFHATVRPPRLGGNTRVGVFASRSPFRPNSIGLSVVKLLSVEKTEQGICLLVAGADLLNGTPIWDVKPYLPHADCILGAVGGYADGVAQKRLSVVFPEQLQSGFPAEKLSGLIDCLAEDPRPSYQDEPERIYGMAFGGYEIKFRVAQDVLTVLAVEKK